MERAGLKPSECQCGSSDGADAATQEISIALEKLHELGGLGGPRRSKRVTCAIHGAALEENAGLDAAAIAVGRQPEMLVDALRMLWEMFNGPDNAKAQYRIVWVEDCKLSAPHFKLLAQLHEPTASKWQVGCT